MAIRAAHWSAFAGLLATMILGCSDANDGANDAAVDAADFIPAAAVAICDDFGACCAQEGHAFAAAPCRRSTTSAFEARLARDTVQYDAEAAGRCVRALHASPGQCDTTPEEFQACDDVFRGTLREGEACTEGFECAGFPGSALCVATGADETRQVCVAAPTLPARAHRGDPCDGTCRADEGPLSCNASSPSPVAYCFTEDGLYCARATSTCEPLLPEGAACERDPGFPGCVAGTFCEHERCVPVRGENDSCLVDVCTAPLSCAAPNELACGPGLHCTLSDPDPRCIAPLPDGSTCRAFTECASGWCERLCDQGQSCADTGVCGPPKRTTREQCLGGFAEDSGATSAPLFLRAP